MSTWLRNPTTVNHTTITTTTIDKVFSLNMQRRFNYFQFCKLCKRAQLMIWHKPPTCCATVVQIAYIHIYLYIYIHTYIYAIYNARVWVARATCYPLKQFLLSHSLSISLSLFLINSNINLYTKTNFINSYFT